VSHLPALGQGPLSLLPSPCRCWRCCRRARIHRVTAAEPRAVGCGGEAQLGAAQQWGSAPRLSTAGPEETTPSLWSCSALYLPTPCGTSPSAAEQLSLALPQLVRGAAVFPGRSPLTWQRPLRLHVQKDPVILPRGTHGAEQGTMLLLRAGCPHPPRCSPPLFRNTDSVVTVEKLGLRAACTP